MPAESGTFTYQWYKNGVLLPQTTQTITATETNAVYTATVINVTGCASPLASKTIAAEVSSTPVLSWVTTGTTANFGDKITYQLAIEHGPATYVWSADGGATVSGSGTSATVTYPLSGSLVNISVKATNACTTAELTKAVTVASACPTPTVTAGSATSFAAIVGVGIQAQVTVNNGNQQTYQWYTNTSASTSGGNAISGATAATVNYAPPATGTTYLYCIVKNGCTGTPQAPSTPLFTVTVSANPASLTLGAGTLGGKACFDINKSNFGGDCGVESSRTASATNFATQFSQPYVFTASGTGVKSNLRFVVVDPLGAVESSNAATAGISGAIGNNATVTLTVNYKKTLSDNGDMIYGKTMAQAVKVQIYAVYYDGAKDVSVPFTVSIQDCACCGAFIAPGVWKEFMCHNLGADKTADPFTPNTRLNGDYYGSGDSLYPRIYGGQTSGYLTGMDRGWVVNPCPTGFRIPTTAEWTGVIRNNTPTSKSVGNLTGVSLGGGLFLPSTGYYTPSMSSGYAIPGIFTSGSDGFYWAQDKVGYYGSFLQASNNYTRMSTDVTACAVPVRCIRN